MEKKHEKCKACCPDCELFVGNWLPIRHGFTIHLAEITAIYPAHTGNIVTYRFSFGDFGKIGLLARLFGHYYSASEIADEFMTRLV